MPLTANQIKYIQSLRLKKNRLSQQLFVAEGEKVIDELLNSSMQVNTIYTTEAELFQNKNVTVIQVTAKELSRISDMTNANKAVALVPIPEYKFDKNLVFDELVLVLDMINNPGNLGTIMRIADWFGIGHIICSNGSVDTYNAKTIQASMGSVARVKCYYEDLPALFASYNEGKKPGIYGTTLDGESIYETALVNKGFIVFGSESHGISPELLPFITNKITIPKFGKAESLNVAVASSIVCAEFRRK